VKGPRRGGQRDSCKREIKKKWTRGISSKEKKSQPLIGQRRKHREVDPGLARPTTKKKKKKKTQKKTRANLYHRRGRPADGKRQKNLTGT